MDSQHAATGRTQASITSATAHQRTGYERVRNHPGTQTQALCPCCNRNLTRIWRRPGDRFLSAFTPLHRFRCDAHGCRWEGNIRLRHQRDGAAGNAGYSRYEAPSRTGPVTFIVHMVLVVIGVVLVFAFAYGEWRGIYDAQTGVERAESETTFP
jgi:hypothetical protein